MTALGREPTTDACAPDVCNRCGTVTCTSAMSGHNASDRTSTLAMRSTLPLLTQPPPGLQADMQRRPCLPLSRMRLAQ